MNSEILAKLRNTLAKLYPDEASMRRVSHDAGLDLSRVTLNSNAINNWHSILIETEKLEQVDALLTVIKSEYGRNREFLGTYDTYWDSITAINWPRLGTKFIGDLNEALQGAQKPKSRPDPEIRLRINRLNQNIIEAEHFDWAKAEQAYLDKVIKLYDRVRILGSSADVPLGNLFTQVYILDKPTARYRHDIEDLRKRSNERNEFQRQPGERIHGLDLVKTEQNLFILGKPGAGKTTFLKYIAIQAAHKRLPRVPMFVSLNQWADSRWGKGDKAALLPFLVDQFDICDFPDATLFIDYMLRAGRALVLFDGLDEVKQEKDQRRRLTHLLQDFARKYDKAQHLITCRIAASDYAFAGFADVEVADFTADQVREYVCKWFGEKDKKFDAFTSDLAKPENKGLAELCNTPLLLSLLCLTFDNTMRFPPNRAELYEDALETLLRKWDSNRSIQRDEIYRALSHKRKLQLLMNIAAPTFQKGELFFRHRDLERWIVDYLAKLPGVPAADNLDGKAILKALEAQHSILVERAQGIYSFSHLTFQEYLAARALTENQSNQVTSKLVRNHLTDRRWRELFLLIASLLNDADEFINAMQQATYSVVTDAPTIIHLLTWARGRTQEARTPDEWWCAVQLAYIFLALTQSRARIRALARDLALTRSLDLDLAFTRALTLALDFERESKSALSFALSCAQHLAYKTTPLVGFDYGLYYIWSYAMLFSNENLIQTDSEWQATMQALPILVKGVAGLVKKETILAQQLHSIPIPLPNDAGQVWQQYADALFIILSHERNLGREWNFKDKEITILNDYFYANDLLVECLKVTAVSDRQSVLNGLLLPPQGLKGDEV